MPGFNIRSAAIPPDAAARVTAFDVVATQAVLPPLPGRRNGESADMGGRAGADPCPAARGTVPALDYGSEAR